MDIEQSTKDELAKIGTQALKDLYDNLSGAKQFVLEQAPDVLQQMIQWQITKAIIAAIMLLGFVALWSSIAFAVRKRFIDEAPAWILPVVAGGLITAISGIIATVEAFIPAIKAITAPKLFLLEQIRAML